MRLIAPLRYSDANCKLFLQNHAFWISSTLERVAKKSAHIDTSGFQESLLFFGERIGVSYFGTKDVRRYLREALSEYLQDRVAKFGELMGLKHTKISIRKTKNRFGSCNHKNELSFSSQLVFCPQFVVDYVIIHELAHIVHKNHSSTYWSFVDEHCAKRKEAKMWIKDNFELLGFLNNRYLS